MTCREFADFMADYLSRELNAQSRERFEQHLAVCPNCRRYLQSYTEAVKAGTGAFAAADGILPDDVPEDLVKAILSARERK
jgi:anti-sigma factor RsiW